MKRFYIAAATLMLGSSALALAQTPKEAIHTDGAKTAQLAWGDQTKRTEAQVIAAKIQLAQASPDKIFVSETAMGGPLEEVDSDVKFDTLAGKRPEAEVIASKLAMADASMDKPFAAETGVGGPLEEDGLAPRPATTDYPPCSPGPGDDNCIQLYEPGVRAQVASWNRATGGLADGSVTTAAGGPYEPVDGESDAASGAMAMAGDGLVSMAMGETRHSEFASADVATHTEYSGVGGPVEAQAGYPPCSRGPGDDRCIQLYERGVTGSGN